MSYDDFINVALDAAVLAGEKIMEVYNASAYIDFEKASDELDRALRKNAKRRGVGSTVKFK